MKIKTLYDRTDLIHITTDTVRHLIFTGIASSCCCFSVFPWRHPHAPSSPRSLFPFAILFAFGMMVLTGHSANLISIGAIDFGILVDAAIIVLEHIYRGLQDRQPEYPSFDVIAHATAESARPVLFSTLVILVALPSALHHGGRARQNLRAHVRHLRLRAHRRSLLRLALRARADHLGSLTASP